MGKNVDSYGNALVTSTYGTQRANAYRLLEDALDVYKRQVLMRLLYPIHQKQEIIQILLFLCWHLQYQQDVWEL